MRPKGRKLEARRAEPEVGFLGRGRYAPSHHVGSLGNDLAKLLQWSPGLSPGRQELWCILGSSGDFSADKLDKLLRGRKDTFAPRFQHCGGERRRCTRVSDAFALDLQSVPCYGMHPLPEIRSCIFIFWPFQLTNCIKLIFMPSRTTSQAILRPLSCCARGQLPPSAPRSLRHCENCMILTSTVFD